MNTYKSTCTHQQTISQRKSTVKTLAALPAKEYGFVISGTNNPKTHVINMVKKGFLDGWFYNIDHSVKVDGGKSPVSFVPANRVGFMVEPHLWTAV